MKSTFVRSLRSAVVLLNLLLCTTLLSAQSFTRKTVNINGNCGGYYEYLPVGYAASTGSFPTIIYVSGAEGLGSGSQDDLARLLMVGTPYFINQGQFPTTFTVNGKTSSFLLIAPQFRNNSSAADVDAVINYAINQGYKIDRSRIYMCGYSYGGGATFRYASNSLSTATRLAAASPVSAYINPYTDAGANFIAQASLPVWAIHSNADEISPVSWSQNFVNAINTFNPGVPAIITRLDGLIHTQTWQTAFNPTFRPNGKNMYEWMLQYERDLSPLVNAGTDKTVFLPYNSVLLEGSGIDPDGTIVSYQWQKIGGPGQFNIVSSTTAQTTVNNLGEGIYQFELRATDNDGNVSKDTVQVTVYSEINAVAQRVLINVGPAASAINGADQFGKYWNNMSDGRPGIRVVNAVTTTNASTTIGLEVINRLDGAYNTGATGLNNTNSALTVGDYPANATAGYAFTYPDNSPTGKWRIYNLLPQVTYTFKFWGRRSDVSDTRIIQIKRSTETVWKEYNGGNNTNYNTSAEFVFNGVSEVSFDIRTKTGSSFGYINVLDIKSEATGGGTPNQLPVVNAGTDQTITQPASSVSVSGTATDNDGTIASYSWTKVAGPETYTITTPAAAQTTITGLAPAQYSFELKATDNNGGIGRDTVVIKVNASTNQPPVANAGNDQSISLPGNNVTLTGSGLDTDGTIASYQWSKLAGGPTQYTIVSPAAATTNITGLVQGAYSFKLTVTDNNGATASDTVTITVYGNPYTPPAVTDVLNCGAPYKIVVIGSSTAFGTGAVPIDSSWVNKFSAYVKKKSPAATIVNLGAGGYNSYQVLRPSNYTPTQGRPEPDTARNISKALSYSPDAIIVNLPSNDASIGLSIAEQQANFLEAKRLADSANVTLWVATTQPRDFTATSQLTALATMRDWISSTFGTKSIDFWSTVSNADGTINSYYAFGDGIHINNYGHHLFFTRVVGEKILDTICLRNNGRPVANAGSDQVITLPTNNITLSGSGTDDGSITGYLWSKISGPTQFTIGTPTAAQTTISNLVAGQYQFLLTVTDNFGTTGKDTVIITVNPALQPPVVNAGNAQSISLPANSTTLSGSATDADGSVVSYSWSKISGGNAVINTPGTASTTISGMQEGAYTFRLTATDNDGITGSSDVTVTVLPVVQFRYINVNLYGNNDPYNDMQWNNWNIGSSLSINDLKYADNTASVIDAALSSHGGLSNNGTPYPTTMCPPKVGQYASYNAGNARTLRLTSLDNDKLYNIDLYATRANAGQSTRFTINGANFVINTNNNYATAATFNDIAPVAGVIEITIWRAAGSFDYLNGFRISEKSAGGTAPVNQAPVVNAGTDQTITLPLNTVNLSGTATDADGSIVAYQWSKLAGGPAQFTINTPAAAQTNISNLVAGQYSFELKATDNGGAVTKDTVLVTVNPAPNQLPVVNAGNDITITLPVNNVTLAGSAVDSDGSIVSYQWVKLAGGPASFTITDPASAGTTVTGLTAGQYSFELTATDNAGASAKDVVVVTVNSASNQIPQVSAGNNQSAQLPVNNVALSGSATDPDGSITGYAWTKTSGGAATITTANAVNTTVTNLEAGTYVFRLTVTDNANATAFSEVTITVTPAVATTEKLINVNLYANNDPYVNTEWNNWNAGSTLSYNNFNYADGSASVIDAVLSAQDNVGNNGTAYPTTMCPPKVGQYTSYNAGPARTLRITSLDNNKLYSIQLFASRAKADQSTRFTINGVSVVINTNNNYSSAAVFENIAPSAGVITVTIWRASGAFDYINGFVLKENSASQLITGTNNGGNGSLTVTNEALRSSTQPIAPGIYPNPVGDEMLLSIKDEIKGKMDISFVDPQGVVVRKFNYQKQGETFVQKIPVNGLKPGVYFVRIVRGSKIQIVKAVKL